MLNQLPIAPNTNKKCFILPTLIHTSTIYAVRSNTPHNVLNNMLGTICPICFRKLELSMKRHRTSDERTNTHTSAEQRRIPTS